VRSRAGVPCASACGSPTDPCAGCGRRSATPAGVCWPPAGARVTRRARITLRFRRTPTAGTYRLEVRAVDSHGLPVRGVARLIVRR